MGQAESLLVTETFPVRHNSTEALTHHLCVAFRAGKWCYSRIAMKKIFVFLGLAFWLGATTTEGAEKKLFDGKSFRGWIGDTNVFHVRDGAIVGGSMLEKIPRNEFLCTRREY